MKLHQWILPHYSKKWAWTFLLLSIVAVLAPLPFHPRQDYGAYVVQWRAILNGLNPWLYADGSMTGNAYGPLFNLFAYPYGVYSHLPHLFFTFTWLGFSGYLLNQYSKVPFATDSLKKALFCLWILNPFFWGSIVSYGHFDILVTVCCFWAIREQQKDHSVRSGVWLAAGVLLKYYPIVLLPFLALKKRKIDFRLIFTSLGLIILGLGLGYIIYGPSLFYPLLFAKNRTSNFLSIFRFLRSPYSPIGNLDFLSVGLMVGSWSLLVVFQIFYRCESGLISIVALYTTFLFYKANHPQFYTALFYFIPDWYVYQRSREKKVSFALLFGLILPLLFISFSKLLYVLTQGFKNQWEWLDDVIGLPAFLVGLTSLGIIVKEATHSYLRKTESPICRT
jgi:Gpi18-like mannosyltransferase